VISPVFENTRSDGADVVEIHNTSAAYYKNLEMCFYTFSKIPMGFFYGLKVLFLNIDVLSK